MNNRAQFRLKYYDGWGGKSMDSLEYSSLFKVDKPHDFGVVDAQLFASADRFYGKKFTAMTLAAGHVERIKNEVYTWTLPGDDRFLARVVAFLESGNSTPGKGGSTFRVALDRPWFADPDVLQSDNNRFGPIEIVGNPVQVGDMWYYTLRLQTGDPNAWIDPSQLQVGATFRRISSAIPTEMNDKRSGIYVGSAMNLQCQIGAFGGEFEVTDRVVRKEIYAKQSGDNSILADVPKNQRLSSGAEFSVISKRNKIERGYFIPNVQMMLRERINMDREALMEFGNLSNRRDDLTGYLKRTAPGWRELVKDSQEYYHNGSLTLRELEDIIHAYAINKLPGSQRKIVISTGEGGWRMWHDMINDEAAGNSFLMVDNNRFITPTTSAMHRNALRYGYQFTEYMSTNGVEITLVYDPMKDDPYYCGRNHPQRNQYTVDSFRFDIYDFGSNSNGEQNFCMVQEEGYQYYAVQSNLVDLATGHVKDGSNVSNFNKGVKVMFEDSGSLFIKDISRCLSVVYEPDYA